MTTTVDDATREGLSRMRRWCSLPTGSVVRLGPAEPLPQGHYDVVECLDAPAYEADDVGWLRHLRRHGDWFLFRFPLDLSVRDVLQLRRVLAHRRVQGRRHRYNRDLALQVLQEAGYAVVTETYVLRPGSAPGTALRRLLERVVPHRTPHLLGGYDLLVAARPAPGIRR